MILDIFKWYISVDFLHKGINIFSSVYAAFEIYIHILFWYHLQFKWYCIYKKRISNCVVTIYSCINLVHILYKQAGTNFLHLKALALYERGKVIYFSKYQETIQKIVLWQCKGYLKIFLSSSFPVFFPFSDHVCCIN